jgi:DNA polymerase
MQKLTELENPNSVIQLKQWLLENGIEVESLSKKIVTDLAMMQKKMYKD